MNLLYLLQPLWAIESDEAAFNACNCNMNYKLRADSAQSLEQFIGGCSFCFFYSKLHQ